MVTKNPIDAHKLPVSISCIGSYFITFIAVATFPGPLQGMERLAILHASAQG